MVALAADATPADVSLMPHHAENTPAMPALSLEKRLSRGY